LAPDGLDPDTGVAWRPRSGAMATHRTLTAAIRNTSWPADRAIGPLSARSGRFGLLVQNAFVRDHIGAPECGCSLRGKLGDAVRDGADCGRERTASISPAA
jgi:hypothetical protein